MKYIEVDSYEKLSRISANILASQIILKPSCVLGLATGSSPLGTYKNLAEMFEKGDLDFSKVTTVNLDEYVGLDGINEQSYRYFMNKNLFEKVNIDSSKTFVPNGCAKDLKQEGLDYDNMIESFGGIDVQLLGIGLDGHIGFNEPDDIFVAETHKVKLDKSTIDANARFFKKREDVPTSAITMGMKSIMSAKKIVLIANGKDKRDIIKQAFWGEITPKVPASILQLHPDVTVIYSEN